MAIQLGILAARAALAARKADKASKKVRAARKKLRQGGDEKKRKKQIADLKIAERKDLKAFNARQDANAAHFKAKNPTGRVKDRRTKRKKELKKLGRDAAIAGTGATYLTAVGLSLSDNKEARKKYKKKGENK